MLEELAISVKQNLISKLPFCAFNGGNDVFVDVGNKSIGLDALMRHLDCYPYEVGTLGDPKHAGKITVGLLPSKSTNSVSYGSEVHSVCVYGGHDTYLGSSKSHHCWAAVTMGSTANALHQRLVNLPAAALQMAVAAIGGCISLNTNDIVRSPMLNQQLMF